MRKKIISKISKLHDVFFCDKSLSRFQHIVVWAAFIGFLVHMLGVLLNNLLGSNSPDLIQPLGTNFISSIFTPFAIILVFEVYLLISALPQTMTKSIRRQYEVISLIVLWGVFKDGSKLVDLQITDQIDLFLQLSLDILAAIVMFALVAIFAYTSRLCPVNEESVFKSETRKVFVRFKKIIALVLTLILIFLWFYYATIWLNSLFVGEPINAFDLQDLFFSTMFSIMIFTDILVVLLSYYYIETYEIIYRNAVFIISTILIRFALTVEPPLNLGFAVAALMIGNIVNVVYSFYGRLGQVKSQS